MRAIVGWAVVAALFVAPLVVSRLLGRARGATIPDADAHLMRGSRSGDGDVERGRGLGSTGVNNS